MGRREEREEREEERRRRRWDAGRCVFQNENPTLNGWELMTILKIDQKTYVFM